MDDAFITLRYARHFADSHHATWNPPGTEAPHVGYTSVAWLSIESILALLIKDPDALFIAAKLAAAAGLLVIAWLFADRLARGPLSTRMCIALGLLLFANAGHGLHVNSAMETLLFCAVTTLVLWSRDRARSLLAAYGWTAFAVLVRPEGLLMAPVLAWFDVRAGNKKVALGGCALVSLTVLAVFAAWLIAYASPVPSAVYLKLGDPKPKRYAVLGVAFFVVLCVPGLALATFLGARRGHMTSKLSLGMTGTLLVFLLFLRPVMNECFRYEWPALFWLAFGALPTIEHPPQMFGSTLPLICAVTLVLNVRTSNVALRYAGGVNSSLYETDRKVGRALGRSMRRDEWLAVADAGVVPYFADVPTHDVYGLADGMAARHGSPNVVLCRSDVDVVVVGVDEHGAEGSNSLLVDCGFSQQVNVVGVRCGAHWIADGVFAREGITLDRAALASSADALERCPFARLDYMGIRSYKTWLLWDGLN